MDVVAKDARNGRVRAEDGFGVLQWMRSFGVAPDIITFNTLVDVCAKSAMGGRAKARHGQRVIDLMRDEGISPDAVTVTGILNLAKADGSRGAVDYARAIFDECPPECKNERAFTALIGALSRVQLHDEAVEALRVAREGGLEPNCYMFNAAMGACVTPSAVLEIYSEMQSCGVGGDDVTARIIEMARNGGLSTRRPVMPDDPQLKPHSAKPRSFKNGLVNL